MAVKVLACSVVTHRGPRVSVAGSDLDVSQIHASIEHSGDRGYLYSILRSARSELVSVGESRESRE